MLALNSPCFLFCMASTLLHVHEMTGSDVPHQTIMACTSDCHLCICLSTDTDLKFPIVHIHHQLFHRCHLAVRPLIKVTHIHVCQCALLATHAGDPEMPVRTPDHQPFGSRSKTCCLHCIFWHAFCPHVDTVLISLQNHFCAEFCYFDTHHIYAGFASQPQHQGRSRRFGCAIGQACGGGS